MLTNGFTWRDAGLLYRAETGETPGGEDVQDETPAASAEDDFDKARALETIRKLRQFEKDAKRLQAEVDAAKKLEDERKAAEMTEVQKAEKKAADAQAALDALQAKHSATLIGTAVRLAASAAGFIDPEDAMRQADLSAVVIGDDGTVTGAKEAVADLAKHKAYLLAAQKTPPNINGNAGGASRAPSADELAKQRRDTDTIYQPF